jgi:hypothetical protein
MHCDLYLCIFNRLRPKFVSFPWWRGCLIWFCLIFSLLSLCSSFDVINERHYLERAKSLYNSWKKRYLRRGLRPLNPHQGLCPWTPLGAYGGPQTPAYFFLVHVIPPHQKFLDPRLSTDWLFRDGIRTRSFVEQVPRFTKLIITFHCSAYFPKSVVHVRCATWPWCNSAACFCPSRLFTVQSTAKTRRRHRCLSCFDAIFGFASDYDWWMLANRWTSHAKFPLIGLANERECACLHRIK